MADVEHSVLTGTDLHEPKGVAAAAANKVYLSNGTGSGSWSTIPASAIDAAGIKVFQGQLYHIRDERASGTASDNLTNNTWNTNTLQTEKTDELTINLASNQFDLTAGTYWCEAEAGVYFDGHGGTNVFFGIAAQSRLRNITDGTTVITGPGLMHVVQHQGQNAQGNLQVILRTMVKGRFTLAGTKTLELQTWPKIQGSGTLNALKNGNPLSSGENEVYADVRIWKIS